MDYSVPGSSAHGIFQARVLEWGAIAFKLQKKSLCSNAGRKTRVPGPEPRPRADPKFYPELGRGWAVLLARVGDEQKKIACDEILVEMPP